MRHAPTQGRGDDIVECRVARRPAGVADDPRRAGDQAGGVAGAARSEAVRHRVAADAGNAVDHFQYRITGGGAEIIGDAFVVEPDQGGAMVGGELGDTDRVADAGAVGGVVVGPEDGEFRGAAEHGVDGQRHQVVFRAVVLADAAGGDGDGGVLVDRYAVRRAEQGSVEESTKLGTRWRIQLPISAKPWPTLAAWVPIGSRMLSPTKESAAKWNTARQSPSASTASSVAVSDSGASTRVRTHLLSQKMTVAASLMAPMKMSAHLSYRVAMRLQSLSLAKRFSIGWRCR